MNTRYSCFAHESFEVCFCLESRAVTPGVRNLWSRQLSTFPGDPLCCGWGGCVLMPLSIKAAAIVQLKLKENITDCVRCISNASSCGHLQPFYVLAAGVKWARQRQCPVWSLRVPCLPKDLEKNKLKMGVLSPPAFLAFHPQQHWLTLWRKMESRCQPSDLIKALSPLLRTDSQHLHHPCHRHRDPGLLGPKLKTLEHNLILLALWYKLVNIRGVWAACTVEHVQPHCSNMWKSLHATHTKSALCVCVCDVLSMFMILVFCCIHNYLQSCVGHAWTVCKWNCSEPNFYLKIL